MHDICATELLLIRGASFFDLSQKADRKESAALLRQLFLSLVKQDQPSAIFEIGAREATFSRQARRVAPYAEIFAFEANTHSFAKYNNDRWAELRVNYIHSAVSDDNGEIIFNLQRVRGGKDIPLDAASNSLMTRVADTDYEQISVPSTTLDAFIAGQKLEGRFAAWIDVEGAIHKVLAGADKALDETDLIMCEVESKAQWNGQLDCVGVHKLLAGRGFLPIARDFEYPYQFNVIYVREAHLAHHTMMLDRYMSSLGARRRSPDMASPTE